MSLRPEDVQATFCATLVDDWARAGVRHAVVSPGSRSTPLALALAGDERLLVHVNLDERSAGFTALGIGVATGEPAVVLTTSGTAAAELHPAVVEAHLGRVPMLVCTADRPPELRDVGAPQAIDQLHLYGRAVRWFHDPGVADIAGAGRWRALAARARAEALAVPGPVHLNLPFRAPLVGAPGELPPPRGAAGWASAAPLGEVVLPALDPRQWSGRRGLVLAGAGSGDPDLLEGLAGRLGWPVLADPRSPAWRGSPVLVAHADGILRSAPAAERLRPELVLRLGAPPASRVVAEWLAAAGAAELVVAGPGRWLDPERTASLVAPAEPAAFLSGLAERLPERRPVQGGAWLARWRRADAAAAAAIDAMLASRGEPTEPGIARAVAGAAPPGGWLVVSSSMPVRDLEWFARPGAAIHVHANRGANGIDGVVSTAMGVAIGSGSPTVALVGDLAFLHDLNGLLVNAGRGVRLAVVVVDNDGGGIFSFLQQAAEVPHERFEQLFGTPHGLDLVAVAKAHGTPAESTVDPAGALPAALAGGGVRVLVARTDRAANVALHGELAAAVAAAVSGAVAAAAADTDTAAASTAAASTDTAVNTT